MGRPQGGHTSPTQAAASLGPHVVIEQVWPLPSKEGLLCRPRDVGKLGGSKVSSVRVSGSSFPIRHSPRLTVLSPLQLGAPTTQRWAWPWPLWVLPGASGSLMLDFKWQAHSSEPPSLPLPPGSGLPAIVRGWHVAPAWAGYKHPAPASSPPCQEPSLCSLSPCWTSGLPSTSPSLSPRSGGVSQEKGRAEGIGKQGEGVRGKPGAWMASEW